MRIVVLGVGNVLMSDEGVGVHAVERLQSRFRIPDEVELVDGGTTGMELLPMLHGADQLIIVDAVRVGQPPGSVVRLIDDEVPAFFKTKLSPHQIGVSDMLAALKFGGGSPQRVVLIGVQPVSLDLAMTLSAPVADRLDEVVGMVQDELAALGRPLTPL
ncbi:MAG TPA: HyaD/HybD family hydrogenase maturation endopeptidase [Rhodospirillaceae bacterium]|nr:HyaD/HybD family hydrogenase maturation endopeptidase [Rhodospirillaceae bacterium]